MAPAYSPDEDSVVARVQTFVEENKKVVLGAAVVAAVGLGYIVYASSRGGGADKGGGKKASKDARKEKKGGKKGKAARRVDQPDGPLMEERSSDEDSGLTSAQIQALPLEERLSRAGELKTRGNSAYTQRKFELAVDLYTQAIAMSPKPEAVFYSNRAACYTNYKPSQHERVIEDCTSALALDPKYAKALNRRAAAFEALDRLDEALRDFTALAIIEHFKNDAASASVERVLAKLSAKQGESIMRGREPRLPSVTFISAYFAAFRPRPHVSLPHNPTAGDRKLLKAQEALADSQFAQSHELVNSALDSGLTSSWREGLAEALNLRGTFKFLTGDTVGAKADLTASTESWPGLVQSWVKIASVYMELSEADSAFAAFENAIEKDAGCADIYYHRGQVFFILSDFERAAEDYRKSSELDPEFVFSHIQLAVAQYKMQNLDASMASFRETLLAFPDRGEPYNYYGELLLDQQRFHDAIEKFDRAIEIEKQKKTLPNPLPLVNKALALYQWKQDLPGAAALCREALTLDNECDAAVATLAQLSLQQGRIEEAIEMFGRHAAIARTEAELVQALSYENASRAQLEFQKNYPDMAGQLAAMAAGMQGGM
ncbi:TOM (translocase of outer membrane) complex component [Ceratobasidium sp. 414]|nr:TOM (translocase of outer membrane) complex component [Ceratobasidium sp. 414]